MSGRNATARASGHSQATARGHDSLHGAVRHALSRCAHSTVFVGAVVFLAGFPFAMEQAGMEPDYKKKAPVGHKSLLPALRIPVPGLEDRARPIFTSLCG
ncbi:MAG TPA: hypothetical protein VKU93_05410 [Terracidiphilus sp.]|nr:hypothetical protein [Terracidiphilus sp.]